MSASHIILASLLSFCKKLWKLVEIWQSSDKYKFAVFLTHGVYYATGIQQQQAKNNQLILKSNLRTDKEWQNMVYSYCHIHTIQTPLNIAYFHLTLSSWCKSKAFEFSVHNCIKRIHYYYIITTFWSRWQITTSMLLSGYYHWPPYC